MNSKEVIARWFGIYKRDIFNFLVYRTGRVDVDDLVQETFIRALRHFESFTNKSSPKTWLLTIARNLAIDEARKRGKEGVHYPIDISTMEIPSSDAQTPERIVNLNETQREIMEAILTLPPKYRDVIILRSIMELTVKETAGSLQWSEPRVRVTFLRGMKQLRQKLSFGQEGELHGVN